MAWKVLGTTVPTPFRCPISMDVMEDPVSLCTGMTYDRSSIRRWLESGYNTCPATMQTLTCQDLTPNHTLTSLINQWSESNVSEEVYRVSTPRKPLDKHQVDLLLHEASEEKTKVESLRQLRAKAKESSKNCRCIAESGAVPSLLFLLEKFNPFRPVSFAGDRDACEAIVGILALVPVDYCTKRAIASPTILSVISGLLSRGSLEVRINTAVLLESLAVDRELKLTVGSTAGIFEGLVDLLLKMSFDQMAVKASLRSFLALCQTRRNRVKAVSAGAIAALIELLPDVTSITAEYALAVLEILCKCAEGRAAFNSHALAIPTVAQKICHHSDVASEYAVSILWAICKHCGEDNVCNCLLEAGVLANLAPLLHLDFSSTTKSKIKEFLKFLKKTSSRYSSPCSLDQECRYVAVGHISSYHTQ